MKSKFLNLYHKLIKENNLNIKINNKKIIAEEAKKIKLADLINDPKRFANIVRNKDYYEIDSMFNILKKLQSNGLLIQGDVFDTVFGVWYNPKKKYGKYPEFVDMLQENLDLLKYLCNNASFRDYIRKSLIDRIVFSQEDNLKSWLSDEDKKILKILTNSTFNVKLNEITNQIENEDRKDAFKQEAFNYFVYNDDEILNKIIAKAKQSNEKLKNICKSENIYLKDDSPNYDYDNHRGLTNDINRVRLEKLCLKQNYSLFIDSTADHEYPKFSENQLNELITFCQQNCDQEFFVRYLKLILLHAKRISDQLIEKIFSYPMLTDDDKREMLSNLQRNSNFNVSEELLNKLNDVDEDIDME